MTGCQRGGSPPSTIRRDTTACACMPVCVAADVTQVMKCRPGGPACCMYPDTDEGKGTLYPKRKNHSCQKRFAFPTGQVHIDSSLTAAASLPNHPRPIHISPNARGTGMYIEICRYLTRKDDVCQPAPKGVVAWHGMAWQTKEFIVGE